MDDVRIISGMVYWIQLTCRKGCDDKSQGRMIISSDTQMSFNITWTDNDKSWRELVVVEAGFERRMRRKDVEVLIMVFNWFILAQKYKIFLDDDAENPTQDPTVGENVMNLPNET